MADSPDMRDQEKLYIGTKLIAAMPMDEDTFMRFRIGKGPEATNKETRPGYRVRYVDGYISWSPKETFDAAYRLITPTEFSMLAG